MNPALTILWRRSLENVPYHFIFACCFPVVFLVMALLSYRWEPLYVMVCHAVMLTLMADTAMRRRCSWADYRSVIPGPFGFVASLLFAVPVAMPILFPPTILMMSWGNGTPSEFGGIFVALSIMITLYRGALHGWESIKLPFILAGGLVAMTTQLFPPAHRFTVDIIAWSIFMVGNAVYIAGYLVLARRHRVPPMDEDLDLLDETTVKS